MIKVFQIAKLMIPKSLRIRAKFIVNQSIVILGNILRFINGVNNERVDSHGRHPVFSFFPPYSGPKPGGSSIDYLGSKFVVECLQEAGLSPTEYFLAAPRVELSFPPPDEEIFEYIDILESVQNCKGSFVFCELGAGYGRWSIRAYHAAKKFGIKDVKLITIEPDKFHSKWLLENMQLNGIPESSIFHFDCAISDFEGESEFYTALPGHMGSDENAAREWYGQALSSSDRTFPGAKTEKILVSRLETIIRKVGVDKIDIVDMDIQGEEPKVLNDSMALFKRIGKFHIGTNSSEDAANINKIFSRSGGFKKIREYPPLTTYKTRYGSIQFTDGVLTYKNRKF
jgi:FkbM family methyltransferase